MIKYTFGTYPSGREGGVAGNLKIYCCAVRKEDDFLVHQFSLEKFMDTCEIDFEGKESMPLEEKEKIFEDFCVWLVTEGFKEWKLNKDQPE